MLIDGHAHLHPQVPLEVALDAAAANLRRHDRTGVVGTVAGVLWLVETRDEGSAERLRRLTGGRWRRTERDRVTWECVRDDGERLVIVRGRQVATVEGLEVLVVGSHDAPRDGGTMVATVDAALGDDRLVMLPWGFGKWTGSRGKAVAACLSRFGERGLRLADTALRPPWFRAPAPIEAELAAGRPVPFGSDPFPFPDHARSVGRAGFVLDTPPDGSWSDMRRALDALDAADLPLVRFGRGPRGLALARLQARMQWRKHGPGRRG